MTSNWRTIAARVIDRVLDDVGIDKEERTRAALRAAYPFGERKYYPYRVWLDECKRRVADRRRLNGFVSGYNSQVGQINPGKAQDTFPWF